jgi:hypothetical protein
VLPDDLLAAFTRIRTAAEEFMDDRDLARLGWSETSVTDVAIHRGSPEVSVVQFNQQQEGRGVGADYLWWWLDSLRAECFGMLVQAKRMYREGDRWAVDVSHRNGRQLGDLVRTAEHLEVLAIYAIYMGGRVFRAGMAGLAPGRWTPRK